MIFVSNKQDKSTLLRVSSGICGNLAAGWFAITLASIFDDPESGTKLPLAYPSNVKELEHVTN